MLRDLTIQNYRAFKDFSIDGLARVNLIVGDNNSGKTSFLEAVYLLINGGSPAAVIEVLDNREDFVIDVAPDTLRGSIRYHVAHIFHERASGVEQDIRIRLRSGSESALETTMGVYPRTEPNGPPLKLVSQHTSAPDALGRTTGQDNLPLDAGYNYASERRFSRANEGKSRAHFLTVGSANFEELADLWDRVIRTPDKETIVIRALQVLERRIEDVRFTTKRTAGGTFVRLAQQPARVTVSSLGEGIRRLLALSLAAVTSEKGVLLVDEIDTGLYHGAQADMWRLLIETAQRLDIQIFATTHSWDCVAAFGEALETVEPGVGRLFRLETRNGKMRSVIYEADELAIAVRETIEVR